MKTLVYACLKMPLAFSLIGITEIIQVDHVNKWGRGLHFFLWSL
jgi:hypothetical protein